MASTQHKISPSEAIDPLVLGLDVGSTASRGGLYDAAARPLEGPKAKIPHAFTTAGDGTSEIDADAVVGEIEQILDLLATPDLKGRIGGVAIDTFSASLVGVDAGGRAVTPCYTYADSRCTEQVRTLRTELDEQDVLQRTGTRIHSSYLPARLRWLAATDPARFNAVDRWMSLGEYIHLRIIGTAVIGTAAAAWTGLLDRRTGAWDEQLVAISGIDVGQLSPIHDPDDPVREVPARVAQRWPALAGAAWYPVIADGFASNVGVGATAEGTVALAAATSGAMRVLLHQIPETISSGLWCYRVDARRSLLGGALNDVGRVVTWLDATLRAPEDLRATLTADPDPATPTVLPYLSGERSTGWAAQARATITDVGAAATADLIYRGAMEGVALSYARVADELAGAAGGHAREIRAAGRVAADLTPWLQVVADALDADVRHVTNKRTTLRGTALIALESLAPDVPRAEPDVGATFAPVPARRGYYDDRARRYQEVYAALVR
ncbi:gluconokinase [Occultella gossypii]|uniref:Gluconokinase n=1 Tax=Occultella gossypii TaxID=2800820 RepID=A0ABS7SD34_9MICO|nr:gluconokinase [Occultella gossypii]MBZ2198274.1 gluconokinase [Occultella gossypii]